MSKKYKGHNNIKKLVDNHISLAQKDFYLIKAKVEVQKLNFINKILDSYENICILVPSNPKLGEIYIITTWDYENTVYEILQNLEVTIISNT